MKIKNREVEAACLTELEVTKSGKVVAMLRLYWTAKAGMYGHQIASMSWTDFDSDSVLRERVTSGCGYCKESDALTSFLSDLFGDYRHTGSTVDYLLCGTKYYKGGNFYSIPQNVLNKLTKKKV